MINQLIMQISTFLQMTENTYQEKQKHRLSLSNIINLYFLCSHNKLNLLVNVLLQN